MRRLWGVLIATAILSVAARAAEDAGALDEENAAGLKIQTYGTEFHSAPRLLIDDYQGSEIENRLGGRANIYVQNPSRVMVSRAAMDTEGTNPSAVLMLTYDKKNEGGPYGGGGWCGYYTLLKQLRHGEEDIYFDALPFQAITFKVKGETGKENFLVGLADRHWDKVGDALKSLQIGEYLDEGHVTTNWQTARIPMEEFFLDRSKLSSISFGFETACFPDGSGQGTIYLDDLKLEK